MRTITATALIAATVVNLFGLTKTEVVDLADYEPTSEVKVEQPAPRNGWTQKNHWTADSRTIPDCKEGTALAEDGTCVPLGFWDPAAEGFEVTLLPCPTEDPQPGDAACYWNALVRGNGQGSDFIFWSDGTFFYGEG